MGKYAILCSAPDTTMNVDGKMYDRVLVQVKPGDWEDIFTTGGAPQVAASTDRPVDLSALMKNVGALLAARGIRAQIMQQNGEAFTFSVLAAREDILKPQKHNGARTFLGKKSEEHLRDTIIESVQAFVGENIHRASVQR